jgi:cell division protein ZapA (FtsZ GTPase activity inhibitor)
MAPKQTVTVTIRGKEFRVLGDEGEESLQRVAGYLDETMQAVARRTGTVDSLEISLLTGLNLARELVRVREGRGAGRAGAPEESLRALIDRVEAELAAAGVAPI